MNSWNAAEFYHWYSRMPNDERKRRAWDDLGQAERKLYEEYWTFRKFAKIAPLDIDPRTIENREPPEPDILCDISRNHHYFELGEVTDEKLAQKAGVAAKQKQETFAGTFSQLDTLIRIFDKKCSKKYVTNGFPLHLLLHYTVGHQVPHIPHIKAEISKEKHLVVAKLQNSPFSTMWLYDGWDNIVIAHVER